MSKAGSAGARSRARELAVQALYQKQIADHEIGELLSQFRERPDYARVNQDYFEESLRAICKNNSALEASIAEFAGRTYLNQCGCRGGAGRKRSFYNAGPERHYA